MLKIYIKIFLIFTFITSDRKNPESTYETARFRSISMQEIRLWLTESSPWHFLLVYDWLKQIMWLKKVTSISQFSFLWFCFLCYCFESRAWRSDVNEWVRLVFNLILKICVVKINLKCYCIILIFKRKMFLKKIKFPKDSKVLPLRLFYIYLEEYWGDVDEGVMRNVKQYYIFFYCIHR